MGQLGLGEDVLKRNYPCLVDALKNLKVCHTCICTDCIVLFRMWLKTIVGGIIRLYK